MKIFSLFRSEQSAKIEIFAKSLADDIAKRYPIELDNNPGKHLSINRLTRILEDTCRLAVEFQQTQKLGVFGKARLGNAFKWALVELGYRKEFIEFATEAVIVHISKTK